MRPLTILSLGLSAVLMLAASANATEATISSRNGPMPAVRGNAELSCLAEAIYFEAGGTGAKGAAAVAHVVVNRANSPKFPGTVCGVISDGCQFSYRCDGRSDALKNAEMRADALKVAEAVLDGAPDSTNGALFFHSANAAPGWFNTRPRVGKIGGNIFYR